MKGASERPKRNPKKKPMVKIRVDGPGWTWAGGPKIVPKKLLYRETMDYLGCTIHKPGRKIKTAPLP